MKRVLAVCGSAAVAFSLVQLPAASALPPPQLRALERVASRLSGLPLKRRVEVRTVSPARMRAVARRALSRDYSPAAEAHDAAVYRALGLLGPSQSVRRVLLRLQSSTTGLYDPRRKRIVVRRGPTERTVVLHELVHALQDQAFGLGRLARLGRGQHDEALAAAAIVEGHASLVVEAVRASAPGARNLLSHGGSRIRLFLELEQEFPYATGLRFAAQLQNLGGRRAIFAALRRLPTTTEQIFHVDAFLAREPAVPIELPRSPAGYTLRSSDTFGELDVRALLAVLQVPRLDHVGEGWGGGLTGVYRADDGREAVAVALDWDTEVDAAQWAEAVATYVNEAFEAGLPGYPVPAGCATCWQIGSRSIAFARSGARTALVFAPSLDDGQALAAGVIGTAPPG